MLPNGDSRKPLLDDHQWDAIATRLRLSARELEIVRCIFGGDKETKIAADIGISRHTVHSHVKRMYRKLEIRDHAELAVRVFETYVAMQPETVPVR